MAPMTRSRAIDNLPNDLMAEYYGQRAGAGLIITEGVAPSPNGLGYPRIPGAFSPAQTEGWKKIAEAVHHGNSKIFMQLMHTGRISHIDNMPAGAVVVGASAVSAKGEMYTDAKRLLPFTEPQPLSTEGVKDTIEEYVKAAENAIEAGFDGVELHSANGYLMEQFLNPQVNTRTDEYGGSVQGRCKFVVEIAQLTADTIGKEKVGIRFSPFSTFNDIPKYPENEVHETYKYLAEEMEKIGIAYIHLSMNPDIPQHTLDAIRNAFTGTLIICNGLTPESAEAALHKDFADLVAFARSYISNPDLDKRIAEQAPLAAADHNTFYSADAKGYTDYPALA